MLIIAPLKPNHHHHEQVLQKDASQSALNFLGRSGITCSGHPRGPTRRTDEDLDQTRQQRYALAAAAPWLPLRASAPPDWCTHPGPTYFKIDEDETLV